MSEYYRKRTYGGREEESSLPHEYKAPDREIISPEGEKAGYQEGAEGELKYHKGVEDGSGGIGGDSSVKLTHEEQIRARKKALTLLTDMDRTEQMLTEKLERAGFSPAAVTDAVEYVRGYGYIDDRKNAAHYLEVMKSRRSLLRIRDDLRKRGISKEILEEVLSEQEDLDEKPLIRSFLEKKARALDTSDPKSRQKLIASASRKGFRISDILHVLDEIEE